ncbi:MAG: hypothetical protein QM532_03490 [Cyanobium sp. MAG06]|nr:hypothetical protein [Cyanobium sp. MAG06]
MLILRIGENTKKRISFDKDILKANSIINTSNIDSLLDYCHANMFGEKLIIRIEEIFATTRASNTKDSESSEQEIESIYEDNVNIDKNEPIDYKKRIYANLENIILSENIFIIDEVSVLAPTAKKLIEDSIKFVTNNKLTKEHFVLLDARLTDAEKKIKEKAEDSNPFPFCNALSIQDKKTA